MPITPTYLRDHLRDLVDQGQAEIGDHSYGNPSVRHWPPSGRLVFGKYCSVAEEVVILLGGNHRTDWITTYPFNEIEVWPTAHSIIGHPATRGDVVIGNDVWLGYGSFVLSGVTIGDGAVVGAKAVVTKSVPPYAIVAGNPARVVRYRFPTATITALLSLRWWDWPEERIASEVSLLMSSNVKSLIPAISSSDRSAIRRLLRAVRGIFCSRLSGRGAGG